MEEVLFRDNLHFGLMRIIYDVDKKFNSFNIENWGEPPTIPFRGWFSENSSPERVSSWKPGHRVFTINSQMRLFANSSRRQRFALRVMEMDGDSGGGRGCCEEEDGLEEKEDGWCGVVNKVSNEETRNSEIEKTEMRGRKTRELRS